MSVAVGHIGCIHMTLVVVCHGHGLPSIHAVGFDGIEDKMASHHP